MHLWVSVQHCTKHCTVHPGFADVSTTALCTPSTIISVPLSAFAMDNSLQPNAHAFSIAPLITAPPHHYLCHVIQQSHPANLHHCLAMTTMTDSPKTSRIWNMMEMPMKSKTMSLRVIMNTPILEILPLRPIHFHFHCSCTPLTA